MTEPETTPAFRKFPRLQLVFCLACLSMAAWTWMKFSYAWPTTPEAIWLRTPIDALGDIRPRQHPWLEECVSIRGEANRRFSLFEFHWLVKSPIVGNPGEYVTVAVGKHHGVAEVELHYEHDKKPVHGDVGVWSGRLTVGNGGFLAVDTTVSRFHGASIAGLVVGAMGCFIFGLYLRRWLIERKALAGTPPKDTTA
ncbi:MAG: hypothetical protein ACYS9X_21515 [Planctomycetota bacterium]